MNQTAPKENPQETCSVQAAARLHQVSSSLIKLLHLELKLALKRCPQVLMLALLFVPMILLCWLGLTILLSYSLYLMSNMVWFGLLSFAIVNLFGLAGIYWQLRRWSQQLTLPHSRSAVSHLFSSLNSEPYHELT